MSTALVVQEPAALAPIAPRVGLLRPIASPQEVIVAQNETRALVAQALREDRDYGVIPGTNKPTLLKAGAERVALAFACYFGEPEIVEREIDHDREVHYTAKGKPAVSYGLYRYVVRVPVIHRETGAVVGYGIGSCSTMESKYVSRPRDCENTALKMAHKRGIVGGALVTFGLSDQFTQDLEDMPAGAAQHPTPAATEAPNGATTSTATQAPNGSQRGAHHGSPGVDADGVPLCPKCSGRMWDNRATKTNPKAPDFKCRDKANCDGVIWPDKKGRAPVTVPADDDELPPLEPTDDEIPF